METLLSAQQLGAQRGDRWLYRQLTCTLRPGELLYVAGPNGAGKTTLLRQLAGLTWCDAGRVERHAPFAYLGHRGGIHHSLTPLQNLQWTAQLYQITQAMPIAWLRAWELLTHKDTPCLALSAGQCRRVALACLCLQQAPVWFLDEPFVALDATGSAVLCDYIAAHRAAGGGVILSSHHLYTLTPDRTIALLEQELI